MTTPTSEEVKALVAALLSDKHQEPIDPKAIYRTRDVRLFTDAAAALAALEIEREGMREDRRRRQQDYEAAQELIHASIKRNMFVNASLSMAEGALRLAALWFRQYETQHRAKETEDGNDKAARNADRAQYLETVVGAITTKPDTEAINTAEGEAFLAQDDDTYEWLDEVDVPALGDLRCLAQAVGGITPQVRPEEPEQPPQPPR